MIQNLKPKIAVIGGGNVGVRYAYGLLIRGVGREIVIVDLDRKRVEGEVADLSHGMSYAPGPIHITSGDYKDIQGSELVVITAGKKQKAGQTRMDVAKDNVAVFREIIPEITKYAPEAIFLVVSNPLDVMTYAAYKISGKPSSEVIGSGTVLDSARFRYLLASECMVDTRNIHAYILGEHGDTEFPVWSKAMIGGMLFNDYCRDYCDKRKTCNVGLHRQQIVDNVKNSAYSIIEKKGETSYGIGLSLGRITQAIINNENAILPVSVHMEGFYGLKDCYLSLPSIVNKKGIREVLILKLDDEERDKLEYSAAAIKKVINETGL
jgi:L-lactate dehydrogenase